MKKALPDEKEIFLTTSGGKLRAWDYRDVDFLIEAANKAVKGETGATELYVSTEAAYCFEVYDWFEWLLEKGVTKEMINEVNDVLGEFRYFHVLMPSKNGNPFWKSVADFEISSDPGVAAAYSFSHLLSIGGLDGLKRCKLKDCQQFFIGPPNAKWCSRTCGSKYRVRKKRKRDLG
jgi:hypothetical protein